MRQLTEDTNPVQGRVSWSPVKSLWFTAHLLIAVIGGSLTFSPQAAFVSFVLTVTTLCLGHSVGLHRLLIHRSFKCPQRFENILVHLGTLAGMGGPYSMMYLHEIRDWAQRHPRCHDFFTNQGPMGRDFIWQEHCRIKLDHPPKFLIEPAVANNRVFQFMERTWMLQQLPLALLLYAFGGIGFVIWGISVRLVMSLVGHWIVGYWAHNTGTQSWHLNGHAIQGRNVPYLGLLAMGESWHNNHHAFPGSARLGLKGDQLDPGWWAICVFRKLGLAWDIKLPEDLPKRVELVAIGSAPERPALEAKLVV